MKKLVMTVAVLACAASVFAQTVTSANIVGYSKADISAGGLQMLSAQFSGSAGGVTLDNAFSGLDSGAIVYAWSGTGYDVYTYYGATYGWYDALFAPAGSVTINSGSAVWVKDAGAGVTTIMSGEVPSTNSVDVSVSVGLNMIANPYPVALTLDDIPAGLTSGDIVYAWNGAGYDVYTYYGAAYGWYDALFAPAGSVEIGVGKGVWLSAQSAATLTFNKAF